MKNWSKESRRSASFWAFVVGCLAWVFLFTPPEAAVRPLPPLFLHGVSAATLAAFPGAEGGGALSAGGRGGSVIEVTNLQTSGGGSLRACIQSSGPRTCVFRVAGLIPVTDGDLRVDNPFLTIAGQTAPGQIILGGPGTSGEVLRISTHDVTVRYITVSPDNYNTLSGPSSGTVGLSATNCNCFNIMYDHVTARWAGNKFLINVSNFVGPNKQMTFQWGMAYEPHAGHPVGPGTSGNPIGCPGAPPDPSLGNPCFTTLETQVDYSHTLWANIDHRIPENDNKSNSWDSNIVYNWSFYANEWLGPSTIDVINNKFVPGNLNGSAQTYPIHFSGNASSELPPGTPSDYVAGNICRGDTSPAADQWGRCTQQINGENGNEIGPVPVSWQRGTSQDAQYTFPITHDAASSLDSLLLPTAGNSQHLDCNGNWVSHRDQSDKRIITQYQTKGQGGFWPNGVTYAGLPTTPGFVLPTPTSSWTDVPVTAGFQACQESQHDGIPDTWKTAKGYSTTDPNVRNQVASNGYTVLENYLMGGNAVVAPPGGGGGGTNVPLTITNVAVGNVSSTSATVTWTTSNPASSLVNYGVCSDLHPTALDQTQVTSHTVVLNGLTPSTQYTFNVESFDGTTTLDSSNATFTTLASGGGTNPTQPAPPVLLATSQPVQSFQLTWTASPTAGVTSYKVYRSTQSGTGFVLKATVTGTIYVDTSVISGQTFYYVVTAVQPNATTPESAFSNQITVVIP